jgi:putative nucleotidyltransferase with HDIG domain
MSEKPLQTSSNNLSQSIRLGGAGRIMLVDDDADLLAMSTELLEALGYSVAPFASVDDAVADLERNPGLTDVVLTDFHMPDKNGVRLLRETQARDPLVVGILVTGFSNVENAIAAMRAGASDMLPKPCSMATLEAALVRAMEQRRDRLRGSRRLEDARLQVLQHKIKLAETVEQLKTSYKLMLDPLVHLLEMHEHLTGEHTKRTIVISVFLAQKIGLDEVQVEIVRRGAMLHDVGKVAISDSILLKSGPLDETEWNIMRAHVEYGYHILKRNPYLQEVAELVYSHHERYDGGGYPRGLRGTEICLGARIFTVADAYDAIRSTRPYSPRCNAEDAAKEIIRCSGAHFDPLVVKVFEENREAIEQLWELHSTESIHPESVNINETASA